MSKFELVVFLLQIILILFFGLFTKYDTDSADSTKGDDGATQVVMARLYPFFQDVHVMIYIGFGFLMVFLKTHCWTSVGFNFIIAAFICQTVVLWEGLWH